LERTLNGRISPGARKELGKKELELANYASKGEKRKNPKRRGKRCNGWTKETARFRKPFQVPAIALKMAGRRERVKF